ncbi:MAG: hypothetical protein AB1817_15575 [Chloroflexota bacterium]
MTQHVNQRRLLEILNQLELDLRELKRALSSPYPRSERKVAVKRKGGQSLYGIFPRSDATMQDFRAARQSWSRHTREWK